jgi:hypothetical protein
MCSIYCPISKTSKHLCAPHGVTSGLGPTCCKGCARFWEASGPDLSSSLGVPGAKPAAGGSWPVSTQMCQLGQDLELKRGRETAPFRFRISAQGFVWHRARTSQRRVLAPRTPEREDKNRTRGPPQIEDVLGGTSFWASLLGLQRTTAAKRDSQAAIPPRANKKRFGVAATLMKV